MRLSFDLQPRNAYDDVPAAVAAWADRVFDWLEQDPVDPRAYARLFSSGTRAVVSTIRDETWVILWEPEGDEAVVRYLGLDTFLPR